MPVLQLDLRIRVAPERRDEFLAFLREAIPFYEAPDGIRVRLLESLAEPGFFVERVVYADRATFDADQVRIEADPRMRSLLARWRGLLSEPPAVEMWELREDADFRPPAPAL